MLIKKWMGLAFYWGSFHYSCGPWLSVKVRYIQLSVSWGYTVVNKFKQNHNRIFNFKKRWNALAWRQTSGKTRIKLQQGIFWIACHVKVFCAHLLPKKGLWHLNASWRECGGLECTRRTSLSFTGTMPLVSQEDCSAAGLSGNSVQIGCNCWY